MQTLLLMDNLIDTEGRTQTRIHFPVTVTPFWIILVINTQCFEQTENPSWQMRTLHMHEIRSCEATTAGLCATESLVHTPQMPMHSLAEV